MKQDKELSKHLNILNSIKNATSIEELPKVKTITSFFIDNISIEDRNLNTEMCKELKEAIETYGTFDCEEVKEVFIKTLMRNYHLINYNTIIDLYNELLKNKKLDYILEEITARREKLYKLTKEKNLREHIRVMREINNAFDIKSLPKVGLSELNKKLIKAVNSSKYTSDLKISNINLLTGCYLNNASFDVVKKVVKYICMINDVEIENWDRASEEIIAALISDETIDYTVEEILEKEKRKIFIYKNDHEYTMETIKNARRISQLPPNLSVSTLTSYLNGNSTIIPTLDRINSYDLKDLTNLLLSGKTFEDDEVKNEIKAICERVYPEYPEAYDLLYNKYKSLPRIQYLIEEITYSLERQKEFIKNCSSNVNVYFIPNNKNIEGGRFYNCYISRAQNLNLEEILPLNLDEIVPPNMDLDSIEWYIQEYYDETFKTAGGIILNRDETIGNISVFRPNDGKVGVSLEEKEQLDQISDLDSQIEEKKAYLEYITEEISRRESSLSLKESKINEMILEYQEKVRALQNDLISNLEALKEDESKKLSRKDNLS